MKLFQRAIMALTVALVAATVHAQTYPSRPVKIVVPFPPGGATDVMARTIAARLQASLGQSFVVENRSGAGGLIGVAHVSKAEPDGYTLLYSASPPIASGLKLYEKVPYDVMRDFTPIAMVIANTTVLLANPNLKVQNFNDLIAYAKANPGKLNIGFGPFGGMSHIVMEQFRLRSHTNITFVPYKGAAPVIVDLLAGHLDLAMDNLVSNVEYIKSNRLRPIAVASYKRSELLPDTPTLIELGLPYMVAEAWSTLLAPAGTPKEIVTRLNEEINKLQRDPSFKALVAKQAAIVMPGTPEEARAFIRDESEKWGKIVVEAGIKAE